LISSLDVPGLPLLRPIERCVPGDAVNSTYPSPPLIVCWEIAPASPHPSQPAVLVNELPLAVAFTTLVQTTFCGVRPPPPAPDGTTGEVASLLIVIAPDTVRLPEVSVATACT